MNTEWSKGYKGYTVQIVGLSHHVYRPGQEIPGYRERGNDSAYLCQSMAAAKRWIDAELKAATFQRECVGLA